MVILDVTPFAFVSAELLMGQGLQGLCPSAASKGLY